MQESSWKLILFLNYFGEKLWESEIRTNICYHQMDLVFKYIQNFPELPQKVEGISALLEIQKSCGKREGILISFLRFPCSLMLFWKIKII